MSTPRDCAEVAFNTTFGTTFGLFTCADLIYEQPALRLLQRRGVRHFVMPARLTRLTGRRAPCAVPLICIGRLVVMPVLSSSVTSRDVGVPTLVVF